MTMSRDREITSKMLKKLRESSEKIQEEQLRKLNESSVEEGPRDNFLTRHRVLMEEAVRLHEEESVTIDKNTPQFGDIRVSQEDLIRKTIGENVTLDSDALKYYPQEDDMRLSGKINSLSLSFQFRYQDSKSDGCYIWCDGLILNDDNVRTIGKINDAYVNWRNSITEDATLLPKLKQAAQQM